VKIKVRKEKDRKDERIDRPEKKRQRERGLSKMATATVSTLCATFGTHCTISHNPKPLFSQPFNLNRFPSHSYNLTFSPRSPLAPLPKSSESSVAQTETETGSTEPEPTQIVSAKAPSWEPGLFAVIMVSSD